jgi:hypothetical protein
MHRENQIEVGSNIKGNMQQFSMMYLAPLRTANNNISLE